LGTCEKECERRENNDNNAMWEFGGMISEWSVKGPPPMLALPVGPEPLGVVPCEPAPEIPIAILLRPRLVCGTHKIECDSRIRRCHSVFEFFRVIEAFEGRAGMLLEMCELVNPL
jgi:hypothetical protein